MTETTRPSLSVVMAAYNEEDAVRACVEDTVQTLVEDLEAWELIVVDDGSTDGTFAILEAVAAEMDGVRIARLDRNAGMGAALRRGFEMVQNEWVTMLPADGQIRAEEFRVFYPRLAQSDCVTSVYSNRRYSPYRWIVSHGLRVLTALIVGTRARTEGTYFVKTSVLNDLRPQSSSFLLNLEVPIRAKRFGYRVDQVSIRVTPRIAGQSKAVTSGRVLQTFKELFKLRSQLETRLRERGKRKGAE